MDTGDGDNKEQEKEKTVHRITRAPKPATSLSGTGGWTRRPESTEVPASPPTNFPLDLWPQTNVILLEAREKFPYQTQTLELCKQVVSQMTPLFCQAVSEGKMNASAVQCEGRGGMEDLLHFLLVHNDDGVHTGFGISDKAFRLGKNVRQSDEWRALARAIVDADRQRTHPTLKQNEHLTLQGNAKTTQPNVDSKPLISAPGKAEVAEDKFADRRAMVDAYIEEVLSKMGKRITRKDIWSAAGYKSRTEFERWERQDSKRPNEAADERFTQILCEKPHLK